MKSVKPGRGPSFLSGIGGVFAIIFGVIWTISASAMGAPPLFTLFGAGFVLLAAAVTVYQFTNATRKKRFSLFDITSEGEETDPLNERFGVQKTDAHMSGAAREGALSQPDTGFDAAPAYCPYCGQALSERYAFCPSCGRELPDRV